MSKQQRPQRPIERCSWVMCQLFCSGFINSSTSSIAMAGVPPTISKWWFYRAIHVGTHVSSLIESVKPRCLSYNLFIMIKVHQPSSTGNGSTWTWPIKLLTWRLTPCPATSFTSLLVTGCYGVCWAIRWPSVVRKASVHHWWTASELVLHMLALWMCEDWNKKLGTSVDFGVPPPGGPICNGQAVDDWFMNLKWLLILS